MRLGKRVIGGAEFEKQEAAYAAARRRAFKYGPRVTGETGETAPAAEAEVPTPDAGEAPTTDEVQAPPPSTPMISLKEMEKVVLAAEPTVEMLDQLREAEFARPEGEPRTGALRLLLKAEQNLGDAAREAVVAELQAALEG